MTKEIVSHRLDLAVRLMNAVTGSPVTDGGTMFLRDGRSLRLKRTNGEEWTGVDTGRENFVLGVNVRGFEKTSVPVRYELLDQNLPLLEIPLIPEQTEWNKPSYLTLEGSLESIEELQAVPLKGGDLYAVSYEENDRMISLYNPHKKILRLSTYAVVNQKSREFELITVLKAAPDGRYQLARGLEKSLDGRSPFVRPVYGMVTYEGQYLIRIPRYKDETEWILRYVADGREYFQTTDLKEPVSLTVNRRRRTGKKG